MKFYQLLALLLLNACLSEQQQEKKNSNKTVLSKQLNCKHELVPGLNRMELGIDLNSLDFYPMGGGSSNRPNGYMESVFSFNCKHGLTWRNVNHNGSVFSLPDDVQGVVMQPTGRLETTVDIASSLSDTKSSLEVQAGIGASYKGVGFAASGGYQQAKEAILKKDKQVALVRQTNSSFLFVFKTVHSKKLLRFCVFKNSSAN